MSAQCRPSLHLAGVAALLLCARLLAVDLAFYPCGDGFQPADPAVDYALHQGGADWRLYAATTHFGSQETRMRLPRATFSHGWLRLTFTTPTPEERTWTCILEGLRSDDLPCEFDLRYEFTVEDLHRFRRQACQRVLAARALEPAKNAWRDRPFTRDELQQDLPSRARMIPEDFLAELPYSLLPLDRPPADPDRAATLPADLFPNDRFDPAAWDAHRRAAAAAIEAPPPGCASYHLLPLTRAPRQRCTFQVRNETGQPVAGLALTIHQYALLDNYQTTAYTLVTDRSGCVSLPIWHDAAAFLTLGDPLTTPGAWRPVAIGDVLSYPRLKPVPLSPNPIPVTLIALTPRRPVTGRLQFETSAGFVTDHGLNGESLQAAARDCRIYREDGSDDWVFPPTSPDGCFTLPPLSVGRYRFLTGYQSRYVPAGDDQFMIDAAGDLVGGGELHLNLHAIPCHQVTFCLLDAESHAPVPGIRVGHDDWFHGYASFTDDSGRFGPVEIPAGRWTQSFTLPSGRGIGARLDIDRDGDYRIAVPTEYRLYLEYDNLNASTRLWYLIDAKANLYRINGGSDETPYVLLPARTRCTLRVVYSDNRQSAPFTITLDSNQTIALPAPTQHQPLTNVRP